MKKYLILTMLLCTAAHAQEDFVDVTNLPGWEMDNQSTNVGTTNWVQGNTDVFSSQTGDPTAFIAANFNNTDGGNDGGSGVICNYLIMPDNDMEEVTFWTRTTIAQDGVTIYPDRLRVLYNPMGTSMTGDCTNDFGDFTDELLVINPNLSTEDYPTGYPYNAWTEFTVSIPGNGRVAFVYHVTEAGPVGNNSNYIGIDTVSWVERDDDLIFADGFEQPAP